MKGLFDKHIQAIVTMIRNNMRDDTKVKYHLLLAKDC